MRRQSRPAAAPAHVHQVYVKVASSPADPDGSRRVTINLLRYIHERLPIFTEMGVAFRVNKVRSQDFADSRLVAALRQRHITALPAVLTPNNVYIGVRQICELYDRNIREHRALAGRGERPVEGAILDEGDDLASLYRDEMTFERAEADAEDAPVGENKDFAARLHEMMERRDRLAGDRRTGTAGGHGRPRAPAPATRAAPPRGAPQRADNIAPGPTADVDDGALNDLLNTLARDIDQNDRRAAFAGPADDGDGDGQNPQDDLMERAFYGNQLSSDAL